MQACGLLVTRENYKHLELKVRAKDDGLKEGGDIDQRKLVISAVFLVQTTDAERELSAKVLEDKVIGEVEVSGSVRAA